MKIQRTLPPALAPVSLKKLMGGVWGLFASNNTEGFEESIKDYFGVKHVFLVSSGKAALYVILKALKEIDPDKDNVIVPAYTCFSVPSAIVKAGLKVTPCDINSQTFDFDYSQLEYTINKDTLCVIPSHLFGIPSDMDRINKLCSKKGIHVVEDTAQAMGCKYDNKLAGTIGDVGFFSLARGKNITCGSGGIIIANSDIVADKIKKIYATLEKPDIWENLRELILMMVLYIFSNPAIYWLPAGLPFLGLGETVYYEDFPVKKLSGMKACLLRYWRDELEYSNKVRRKNGSLLSQELDVRKDINVDYLRFPVIMKDKSLQKKISAISKDRGLGISCMYPRPLNEIEEIKEHFSNRSFPSAKMLSEQLITLPTHHFVSEKDIKRAAELIKGLN